MKMVQVITLATSIVVSTGIVSAAAGECTEYTTSDKFLAERIPIHARPPFTAVPVSSIAVRGLGRGMVCASAQVHTPRGRPLHLYYYLAVYPTWGVPDALVHHGFSFSSAGLVDTCALLSWSGGGDGVVYLFMWARPLGGDVLSRHSLQVSRQARRMTALLQTECE